MPSRIFTVVDPLTFKPNFILTKLIPSIRKLFMVFLKFMFANNCIGVRFGYYVPCSRTSPLFVVFCFILYIHSILSLFFVL